MKHLLLHFLKIALKLKLRFFYRSVTFKTNIRIGSRSFLARDKKMIFGENFFMGRNCHISAPVSVGDNVMLASFVTIVGGDHRIDYIDVPMNQSGRDEIKTTYIHDNVWVGHGAIILHGVTIHTGAVVAAGSVVTKDVESNCIVAGNPAKFIRFRKFL